MMIIQKMSFPKLLRAVILFQISNVIRKYGSGFIFFYIIFKATRCICDNAYQTYKNSVGKIVSSKKKKKCIEIYWWTVFSSSFVWKNFSLKAFLQCYNEGWIFWKQSRTLGCIDKLLPTRVAMTPGTRLLGTSIRRQWIFILLKDLISFLLNDFKRRLTFIFVRSRLAHPFVLSVSSSEAPFAIF